MKVLITGSAGFIGYHLAKKFLYNKIAVVGFDNMNNYYDPNVKYKRNAELKKFSKYKFYRLDICDFKKIQNIFKKHKFKAIVHLAAQAGVRYSIENPFAYIKTNLEGFYNILHLANKFKVQNFIYASSSSVYGNQKKLPIKIESNTNNPQSLYAATKKNNEIMAESYNQIHKLNCTGLRFFTNYGNFGRPDMSIFKFTKNIINGKPIKVFNNGNHKRDFTHISDSVEMIFRILKKRQKTKNHEIFNIGSGKKIDLMMIIKLIEKYTDKKAKIIKTILQKGDVKETHANIHKTTLLTKYKPKKKIENGIRDFVFWYKNFI